MSNNKNIAVRAREAAEKCATYCVPEAIKIKGDDESVNQHVCLKIQQEMLELVASESTNRDLTIDDLRSTVDQKQRKIDMVRETLALYADPENWEVDDEGRQYLKEDAVRRFDRKDEDGKVTETADSGTPAKRAVAKIEGTARRHASS